MDDIERFDGRLCSREVDEAVCVVLAVKPGLTGMLKSTDVVQLRLIRGWQVSDSIAFAFMVI